MNRDTLYSAAVFDLDAGPVTITLPDAGNALHVDAGHQRGPIYADGSTAPAATLSTGRRSAHAMSLLGHPHPRRSERSRGSAAVHALQDAIKVEPGEPGQVRGAELGSGEPEEGARRAARARATTARHHACSAPKDEVDPVRHLIGTAAGVGRQSREGRALSQRHAREERRQDGLQARRKDVPVDGFWSISVYNAEGYFEPNPLNAYTLNNLTAKKNADGSVDDPVRRLRRQDPELPADHERLELHGAALSAARRDSRRHLEIPRAAAGQLVPLVARSGHGFDL